MNSKRHRLLLVVLATVALFLMPATAACTTPDPTPAAPTVPSEAAAASPTETVMPAPTATEAPAAPTFTPVPPETPAPTETPAPPTNTPAPTFTPRPLPASTPTPTRTPGPTRTPRPTSTRAPPSPIAHLENGAWLDQNRRPRAMELRSLPWVADGVDESEKEAAELLIAAARWYSGVFDELMKLPWVSDSITPAETDAIFGFRWMPRSVHGQVDEVLAMPWTQDEITAAEGRAVRYLYFAGRYVRPVADELLEKSWVQDDMTANEATVIQNLYWTARVQDEAQQSSSNRSAIANTRDAFPGKVEGPTLQAVAVFGKIGRRERGGFAGDNVHPKILDGITDEEAQDRRPFGRNVQQTAGIGRCSFARDRGVSGGARRRIAVVRRSRHAIVRIRDQTTDRMDCLSTACALSNSLWTLPCRSVTSRYISTMLRAYQIGGTNFGSHIAMSNCTMTLKTADWWTHCHFTIAHEVAHYYWGGSNQDWIDEGAAEFLGSISEQTHWDDDGRHSEPLCVCQDHRRVGRSRCRGGRPKAIAV